MGHGLKRCKEPIKVDDGFGGGDNAGFSGGGDTGFSGGDNGTGESADAGGAEWETPAAPAVSAGGW